MSNNYKLSPTKKLNYVQKASPKNVSGSNNFFKKFSLSFVLIAVLLLILVPYFKKIEKQRALEEEIRKAKEEVLKYEVKSLELKDLINYLESDQAIEERARINFGLRKEGEKVVVIKRDSPDEELSEEEEADLDVGHFKKWYNYFFK